MLGRCFRGGPTVVLLGGGDGIPHAEGPDITRGSDIRRYQLMRSTARPIWLDRRPPAREKARGPGRRRSSRPAARRGWERAEVHLGRRGRQGRAAWWTIDWLTSSLPSGGTLVVQSCGRAGVQSQMRGCTAGCSQLPSCPAVHVRRVVGVWRCAATVASAGGGCWCGEGWGLGSGSGST